MPDKSPKCPHCGEKMLKWQAPPEAAWESEYHHVCFNDDCPYYVRGWERMLTQYQAHASYRCRINPKTGKDSPLPVWSPKAHKDMIIKDDEETE